MITSATRRRIDYDPESWGAKCPICAIRDVCQRISPKGPPDAPIAIVGEGPGVTEIERRSFFVGVSGRLLLDLFAEANKTLPRDVPRLRYDDLWITNAILGKPKIDLDTFMTSLRKRNKELGKTYRDAVRRAERGARALVPRPDIRLDPFEACRPRLMKELANRRVVIPMGSYALATIDPKKRGIMKWFGGPFQMDLG